MRLDWEAMEAWFEEDEEVYTHPRDPYTRVDILASSRLVRVKVDGMTVADSTAPRLLFETGLPVRYYLPRTHVRMDMLERSETVTHCPYKGRAADLERATPAERVTRTSPGAIAAPLPESQKIAGMFASTTRRSISTSMASHSLDHRRSSADRRLPGTLIAEQGHRKRAAGRDVAVGGEAGSGSADGDGRS